MRHLVGFNLELGIQALNEVHYHDQLIEICEFLY